MMLLKNVSRVFDKTPAYDPDTGVKLFDCQFNNYDGSHRDAHSAYRRVLSTAPGTVMPASRTVQALTETWLVGEAHYDGHADLHRQRHVVQKATGKLKIYTLLEYLTEQAPSLEAWGDIQWAVGKRELEFSSDNPQVYDVFFPVDHDLPPHRIIEWDGRLYLGQYQYLSAAGFALYQTYRQARVREKITVVTRQYVPSQGKHVEVRVPNVPALEVRWQEYFEYKEKMADKYDLGDRVYLVPSSTDVNTTSKVEVGGRQWAVIGMDTQDGIKHLHVRPA